MRMKKMRTGKWISFVAAIVLLFVTAFAAVPAAAAEGDTADTAAAAEGGTADTAAAAEGGIAAAAIDNTDAEALFKEKIQELGKEYGFMRTGTVTFEAENKPGVLDFPEDIAAGDEGILLANVSDYDGDGSPELLVIRRQRGYVNIQYGYYIEAADRYEYLFEMYEAAESECKMDARFEVGVCEMVNVFTFDTSASFFLRETEDGTYIYMETLFSGQDHPEDISLVCFRYKDGYFHDFKGFRYGILFSGDKNVVCLSPESISAYGCLSTSKFRDNEWKTEASANNYSDETFRKVLNEGLEDMGLTLIQTRYDMRSSDSWESSRDKDTSITAKDCYAPADGNLELLGFIDLHMGGMEAGKGMTAYKSVRDIFTDEAAGIQRDSSNE